MTSNKFKIESKIPFSESSIWQLNRDYYQEQGLKAWSAGTVPHHMTSNAQVGKTYAELIFAFLKDLVAKGSNLEVVYIIELGAGHGRLAFHILKHLEVLVESISLRLPKYCYVLSDIVEDNLSFFHNHPQFQKYLKEGLLDLAYFDAIGSKEIYLRHSKKTIYPKDLVQPILAIANYFFDSIPNDLYFIKDNVISTCSISIESSLDPKLVSTESLLKNIKTTYENEVINSPQYKEPIFNEMLEEYKGQVSNTYLFFPEKSIKCLENLKTYSKEGLVLLTLDKGFHEVHNLNNKKEPEIIAHGSFSLWVNYHALKTYCLKQGGKTLFPSFSNFHLEVGCLLFLPQGETYKQTDAAYQQFVNNFGPDDYTSVKHLVYSNISRIKLEELFAFIRLSAYDSTIFIKLLPRIKQLFKNITHNEQERLVQTMHSVWDMYFHINEPYDLPYEIGGLFFDLGHYKPALTYFQLSEDSFGEKADVYYNRALCYYQLRQDKLFYRTLAKGRNEFPDYKLFDKLDNLEMD